MNAFLKSWGIDGDVLLAASLIGLLAIMLVPLPAPVLDMLLAGSIGLAMLLFMAALYAEKPVRFSVFPTALLVATVYRLALNVASTRLILLNGSEGSNAAGKIIEAFGQFVVGGNYVVGGILFVILVLINFVVVTKGAGRIAEVAARFTLDAMPGKQMAIDAELNSGMIDEHEAKRRRSEVATEADFYGAMDGASKFIRGDAIAGIVITLVNAFGGTIIGVVQREMPIGDAFSTYLILTIGDGLAGQVPALVVSIAAGLLVARVQPEETQGLAAQMGGQVFTDPRALGMSAAVLGAMALIPGLTIPFAIMAGLVGTLAYQQRQRAAEPERPLIEKKETAESTTVNPKDLLPVEPLALEVAVDLLYLVDDRQGGELLERVQWIRRQFAEDLGVLLPPVNVRDNLDCADGEYVLRLRGEEIGRGKVTPRQHMAMDPGGARTGLNGLPGKDPVFGLDALWIADRDVLKAQRLGFTVVDVQTVITTHLVELLHVHAHELLDGKQLDDILQRISEHDRRLVDELVPDKLNRQGLLRVMRNLVKEHVSVRDSQTILEAVSEYVDRTQDPDLLTEFVRQRLSRHITHAHTDPEGIIHYVALSPDAEQAILRGVKATEGRAPSLVLDPSQARKLITELREKVEGYPGPGQAVVLCPPLARGALRRLIERVLPKMPILSSAELLPAVKLESVGTVELA
ncbi:MAG: flagellar biosynthesis protein FlhA [Alphaproteobacteria bacterium]|nr:flagellar biosynthesis protein FlhA [Alphaproteobacteria bacterium]